MKKTIWILIIGSLGISGCEEILEVPDISNQQIQLLAPLNGTVVNDSMVSFNWEDILDAEGYVLQVATPNFENANQLVLDTIIVVDSTFTGTRFSKTLNNNLYEWRVKGFNSDFETGFSNSLFEVNTAGN